MKEKSKKIIGIIPLLLLTYIFSMLCFSNPLSKIGTSTDSSVFTYIAQRINEGEMPYKDLFDHKGPITYLINLIGVKLSFNNINGIYIVEFLTILITVIFTQKILREVFKFKSLEATILNFLININITFYLEGGNYTELYALPIIVITLYLILMLDSQNIKRSNFVIGILLGIVVGLRANMIAIWIVYYIFVLVKCLKDKKIKTLIDVIIFSFLGLFSSIGIQVIFLIKNNILIDFVNDYLIFNFKYLISSNNNILNVFLKFIERGNICIYTSIVILDVFLIRKNKTKLFSIIFSIVTWLIVIQPKNIYYHYGIILIPTFIIPLANIYKYLKEKINNETNRKFIMVFLFTLLSLNSIVCYIVDWGYINIYKNRNNDKVELSEYVKENSNETDKILVIGNDCEIYLLSNRISASKYEYQAPIYKMKEEVLVETIQDIKINTPKYIVIINNESDQELNNIIINAIDNEYLVIKEWGIYRLYQLGESKI